MLDTHLKQLSKELEFDSPLEAVKPGIYEYFVDEDVAIILTAIQPQGFTLKAILGPYPKETEEEFFMQMMTGNLLGRETFGASLGLTEEGDRIILSRTIESRVDYREFKEIIEDFYHIIVCWRELAGITKS